MHHHQLLAGGEEKTEMINLPIRIIPAMPTAPIIMPSLLASSFYFFIFSSIFLSKSAPRMKISSNHQSFLQNVHFSDIEIIAEKMKKNLHYKVSSWSCFTLHISGKYN